MWSDQLCTLLLNENDNFDLQCWHNKTKTKTTAIAEVTSVKQGKIKWDSPFSIIQFFFPFHLTVSGFSFFLDFMGFIKHSEAKPLRRSGFVKADLPVAI